MTGPDDDQAEWVYLSTVEDVFLISGRGLIVAPGAPTLHEEPEPPPWTLNIGDTVRLERPDGGWLEALVRGMVMGMGGRPVPVLLGPDLTKDMVPVGTKLWIRASASP